MLSWKLGAGSTNPARRVRTAHLVNVLGPDGNILFVGASRDLLEGGQYLPRDGGAASAVTDDSGLTYSSTLNVED